MHLVEQGGLIRGEGVGRRSPIQRGGIVFEVRMEHHGNPVQQQQPRVIVADGRARIGFHERRKPIRMDRAIETGQARLRGRVIQGSGLVKQSIVRGLVLR